MMSQESNNSTGLIDFFKAHPILVGSLLVVLCSGVGYWSEYKLMQNFGINIVVFAEADDFLLVSCQA
jgi:hypothetical protein